MADIACSILIVSDDDLVPDELVAALGAVIDVRLMDEDPQDGSRIHLDFTSLRLHGSWDMPLRPAGYDLCVVAMDEMTAALSETVIEALMRRVRSVLWLGEGSVCAERRYFRSLPACMLTRPVGDHELRAAVVRLLGAAMPWPLPDRSDFLRRLLASGIEAIDPVISHADVGLVRYPAVERLGGMGIDGRSLLEDFVRIGALERHVGLRLRLCSACSDHRLLYEERCGDCGSLEFVVESMIHHFACGTVALASDFGEGDERRCPKCREPIRTLGLDHQRYADRFTCACGATTPHPEVLVRCLGCGQVQEPQQTTEVVHPRFVVTRQAHQVVDGWEVTSPVGRLREQRTRLFRRQVLIFEIKREEARAREIGSCFGIIAVVVRNSDELRHVHGSYGLDHVETLLAGCVPALRLQDIAVRWSLDTAVILLPDTVADDLVETVQTLSESLNRLAKGLAQPGPVVGIAGACSTDHADTATVVRCALAEARAETGSDAPISDSALFVVQD